MKWTTIHPSQAITVEKQLQFLLDQWSARRSNGWVVGGAPAWLRNLTAPNSRKAFTTSLGYDFIPDALFELPEKAYLLELKLASKYEPLALAEVLHHAWMLERDSKVVERRGRRTQVVPVVVSQQNFWLRAALARLSESGLTSGSICYLEFDTFEHRGQQVLWLGDPLAPWAPCPSEQVPPEVVEKFPGRAWHFVEEEDSWLGMREPAAVRPIMPSERHVWCSRTEAGTFVAWEGSYTDQDWKYWICS